MLTIFSSTNTPKNKVSTSNSFNANGKISKDSNDLINSKTPLKTPKKSKSPG